MGTLTLSVIRNLMRSELNELTVLSISNSEIDMLINDGVKDVAIKGLCYEKTITKSALPLGAKLISVVTDNIVSINTVSYLIKGVKRGMECVLPQTIGHIPINGNTPQYWFQWGNYVVIEPVPDAATYTIVINASCYPEAIISLDEDLPSSIPVEFHECVYLYALAFACFKLKKWQEAGVFYNRYIEELQIKKMEYVIKSNDARQKDIPAKVTK